MVETLEEMFVYKLKELYHIETRLVDVLEQQSTDVSDEKLTNGFRDHKHETQEHVARLEKVFDQLGLQPEEGESKVLDALVEERKDFRDETDSPELRDLYDVGAGMKIERLELTGYQGLIMLANRLEYSNEVVSPLEDNLSSERATFYKLQAYSEGSKLKEMVSQIMR